MDEARKVLVKAVVYSVEKANPTLKNLLELHLKSTTGQGFELAYNNPTLFKESVAKLFGEYSSRLLEMIIIGYFRENLGMKADFSTLEDLVEYLKTVYG
ncbi:DUF3227 domain-containing protein [Thermococcus sp. M36]|uniref:NitrOD5 domain-containing protein n=1 Tax=Thermococcus sp. M36 TaxID=1638261 RepID=UPI00143B6638|nr:NitrOD5 domain-containing protein [Thermococcus sp. M36]NJE04650.1 DUF3227 domain-containing protein [Thermococcus sp. M36]